MKKIWILVLISVIPLLTSCTSDEQLFSDAVSNMETVDNMRIFITIKNVPLLNTVTSTIAIDGDRSRTIILGDETFRFSEDGIPYVLKEHNEIYYRFKEDEVSFQDVGYSGFSAFLYSDFVKIRKGVYETEKTIDNMSNVRIEIDDGYITELSFDIPGDTYTLSLEFDYFEFGEAYINLPEYIILEGLDYALFEFSSRGYAYYNDSGVFTIHKHPLEITLKSEDSHFLIVSLDQEFTFYPDTEIVEYNTISYSIQDYLGEIANPILSIEEFNSLMLVYNELRDD